MNRLELFAARSLLTLCGVFAVHAGVVGQGQQNPGTPEAPNPAFAEVEDDPALPGVLLIGDSISIGYTLPTRSLLVGKANVHRIPVNGGPTSNGLENLDRWLGSRKWNVIHFNWGLHDLKLMDDGTHQVPLDKYAENLRVLVGRLKQTGATLIWASTTPVPDADVTPPRKNSDVVAYDAVARQIMEENGIPIDDLYPVAFARLGEIQRPANVHFTDPGYEVLAESVAASIRAALGSPR